MKSWNKSKNIDCFGNGNPRSIDHIWPSSKGGSNTKINQMFLSKETNNSMGNKTSGRIGQYKWSKMKAISKKQEIYGVLKIRHDSELDKQKWIVIMPVID